ncbi:endonuclease domain-containing protein [Leifsonia aquatica]|uniref:endonuclease domain-containing protein n=1 Tax=Leifsonia aquatica TaxID=144185 RepID=UPI00046A15F4|nr:hypothetical protein [Leifsonia aquatica]
MQPTPLPPEFRNDPFRVRDARAAGISSSRLRRADLSRPTHGVRSATPARLDDTAGRCRELLPVLPDEAIFSHATAAVLHGLPVPARLHDGPLHVAVPHPTRAPRRPGVVGHQLERIERVRVGGIPTSSRLETWVQLGALLPVDDLVVAGDALLRRHDPHTSIVAIDFAVDAAAGRPGIRRLRTALTLIRPRTDSPMETVLRLAIVRAGLPEPSINHVIPTPTRDYHADLAYPALRVAIEYDGDHHRTDAAQFHTDIDRLFEIEAAGWRVVRLNRSHLTPDAALAIARITSAMATSGHDTPWARRL